jgi:hypothetical protein
MENRLNPNFAIEKENSGAKGFCVGGGRAPLHRYQNKFTLAKGTRLGGGRALPD